MFACIYYIMCNGNMFYVKNGKLEGTDIDVDYIRSKIISSKGVNVGMRLKLGEYVIAISHFSCYNQKKHIFFI